MTEYKYNNNSHCKINGTERSILTALSQTLRLVANPVTTGKVPDNLFAACRVNKLNLNIVDWIALMSKLKTVEMMYSIQLKVAIATVFEMQRHLKFPELNEKYIHVKSSHPSDSDDVALKCYNFLWVTTKSFEVSVQDGKPFENVIGDKQSSSNSTVTPITPIKSGQVCDVPNNTPVSGHEASDDEEREIEGDSEDILPKRNLRDTGKTLGKKQIFSRTNSTEN